MRPVDPQLSQDLVERKVVQLHGSGLPKTQLRLGCQAALEQKLPLRDAIVIRAAGRFAPSHDREVLRAWIGVRQVLRRAILRPGSYAIWIKPIRPVRAAGDRLVLMAPPGIKVWVERRYSYLIREALEQTNSGYTDVEFVSAGEGM